MPRREQPITEPRSALGEFAFALRELRHQVGSPTYRELAERTGYAASTLWKAASGKRLPTLDVTLAFVDACGGDSATWRFRWFHARATQRSQARATITSSSRERAVPGAREHRSRAAAAVAAELRAMVAHVAEAAEVRVLMPSQLREDRERTRYRRSGSTRHLADTISASRGSAGTVSHVAIAKALTGDPRHALDTVLVLALARASHELCGAPFTARDERFWLELLAKALTRGLGR